MKDDLDTLMRGLQAHRIMDGGRVQVDLGPLPHTQPGESIQVTLEVDHNGVRLLSMQRVRPDEEFEP